jgi:hypothetical protein
MYDSDMHREYTFCAYLLKLIPNEPVDMIDLEGKLKLEYYKLKETFKGKIELDPTKGGNYGPVTGKGAGAPEPKEPLDEIIDKINEKYKGIFTEGDKVLLTSLRDRLLTDKKLKKIFGLIMGVIAIAFLIMAIPQFDLPEYLAKGRTFLEWVSYTGFMFYFLVFLMASYLTYHFLTFYQKFPKRLEKATADYYKSSAYLTNEIILAVYEDGVLEKAAPRDEFFEWGMFNRCWESENVVYLEFTLANQLFVAKEVMLAEGVNIEEFIAWANEKIEEGKKIMAEREAAEEAAAEAEDEEFEEIEKEIEALEAELSEEE